MATDVYRSPTTQQAIGAASAPPLSAEKFHPVNSPTSTMPTPSAQTWAGPSTRSRETFWAGTGAVVAVAFAIYASSDPVFFGNCFDLAFPRGCQHFFGV